MRRDGTRITLLVICLVMISMSLSAASIYPFGTKVEPGQEDIGRPLNNLFGPSTGATVMMWDVGPNPGFYDQDDVLYLVRSPSTTVTSNSIRLTNFDNCSPGSKVTPQDKDIGMPLSAIPGAVPAGGSFAILDLYGTSSQTPLLQQYNLADPVYWHRSWLSFATDTNDIRLSKISDLLVPGTKLNNFDPDHFKPMSLLNNWQLLPSPPESWLKFYDANGNGIYDYPDDVYLIRPIPGRPAGLQVTINSIRLSGPVDSIAPLIQENGMAKPWWQLW